jgi:hypothetical protein
VEDAHELHEGCDISLLASYAFNAWFHISKKLINVMKHVLDLQHNTNHIQQERLLEADISSSD